MTSPEQAAANRENSKKSTGPKTEAGKARAARNAVTHGLTARPGGVAEKAAGPGDPTEAYRERLGEWIGDWKPRGVAERTLTERACRAA